MKSIFYSSLCRSNEALVEIQDSHIPIRLDVELHVVKSVSSALLELLHELLHLSPETRWNPVQEQRVLTRIHLSHLIGTRGRGVGAWTRLRSEEDCVAILRSQMVVGPVLKRPLDGYVIALRTLR